MSTHVGKIGRLPKCTRDELGRRIENGEPGVAIVDMLDMTGAPKRDADKTRPNPT